MQFPHTSTRFAPFRLFALTLLLAFVMPEAHAVTQQLTFTPANLRFGEVALGQPETMVATVANTGSTSVTVSTMQVNAPEYTVSRPTMPFNLGPGQSIDLKITFQPTQGGAADGNITFNGQATYLYLHGWGLDRPSLVANPSSAQFGSVPVGSSVKVPIVLTNLGSSTVTIAQELVTGVGFAVDGVTFPLTLASGQTQTFNITFAPQLVRTTSGSVMFSSATNTVLFIPLTGVGVNTGAGQLTIGPSSMSFGSVAVGGSTTLTGTLNAAAASVTVSSASSSNSEFSLTGISLPVTIPTGQSASFTVTFAPRTSGAASANLSFASNAGNNPNALSLSGTGGSVSAGSAHGMFILDPPSNDNNCAGMQPSCYSRHLIPTLICTGSGTPAGYNCTQKGAGEPYVKGAIFYIRWDMVNPTNGTYDFSMPDNRMQPWIDAGKMVSFDFIPTSQESSNNVTPAWYLQPIKIASVSQTGGIITLQTSGNIGFFAGGISAAPGLEIQITGTGTALDGNGTSANSGIWTVCDHTTAGCQDPTAQTIYALGAGSDVAAVRTGMVGNPVYGSPKGGCGSGIIPIEWRVNFQKAWQSVMQQVVAHYATNSHVAYLRFGMGIGGENIPNHGTNVAACQAQMTKFGFTTLAPPWPTPTNSQWPQVSATWIAYQKTMLRYEHSLNSPKPIGTTISPIEMSGGDLTTPDATAANAVASGIGFGNQGLQKNDPLNYAEGLPCFGGDWCANLQKYRGQVPLELQTLFYSDPTDANQVGSLVHLVPFATLQGAQILELYVDDWLCTYDSSWNGNNTYGACTAAGYPAVFSVAASQIN